MLVLPPVPVAQVALALAAVALSALVLAVMSSLHRKMRAARLLAPVPGPKGRFLLGFIPELMQNLHRIHDFQVRLALVWLLQRSV